MRQEYNAGAAFMGLQYGKYSMPGSGKYSQLSRADTGAPLPPVSVSFQDAYNGGATINPVLVGKPVDWREAGGRIALNVDVGSQKIYTDYNIEARGGATTHLINQQITSSLTITQEQLDRVNVNYTSNLYIYTLPDDTADTFPNGSQFELLQLAAGGQITLNWPGAVKVNGVINGSVDLTDSLQSVIVRKLQKNVYVLFTKQVPSQPVEGVFTPVIVDYTNLTAASALSGSYVGQPGGKLITVHQRFYVLSDGSSENAALLFQTPLTANFTDAAQAWVMGQPAIVPNIVDVSTGNIGAGAHRLLNTTASEIVYFEFETATINTNYYIDMTYQYQIQDALKLIKNNHGVKLK